MKILFVCTGNTCRSPMAAALMRRELDKRGRTDIIIESAGLAAFGEPASRNAVDTVAELDEKYAAPLKDHISRSVTAEQIEEADLIAVMSDSHAAAVIERGADPEKVSVLGADGGSPTPSAGISRFTAGHATGLNRRYPDWRTLFDI